MQSQFRVGDFLTISCPFRETIVTALEPSITMIRWPWWREDPHSVRRPGWNGDEPFYTEPDDEPGHSPFQVDPAPHSLNAGDACRVGIPPTIVYVLDVAYSKPLTAPPDVHHLRVARAGQTYSPFPKNPVWTIGAEDTPRVEIDFLFRPYAFLEVGDEVADRYGQVWRFNEPWEWRRIYSGSTSTPEWPLVLLTLDGAPGRAAIVKEATSVGSHDEEITRWRWLSDTTPLRSHP